MSANMNPQDPLAFVKNIWSSMGVNLPGMVVPTIDPDELEKRIRDLRAVEGWLRMNLNMLSATINTLDVQRATLLALKSFRQSAAAPERPESTARAPAPAPAPAPERPEPSAAPASGAQSTGAGEKPQADVNPFLTTPSVWPWNLIQQAASEAAAAVSPKPEGGQR